MKRNEMYFHYKYLENSIISNSFNHSCEYVDVSLVNFV